LPWQKADRKLVDLAVQRSSDAERCAGGSLFCGVRD
jgi:hypothetical protein